MDVRYRSSPLQNVPGVSDQWRPASSGEHLAGPLTLLERFMSSAPPSTLANVARIINQPVAWRPSAQLQGVLRCTLPLPQPVGLSISSHFPSPTRFPPTLRLPWVQTYNDGEGAPQARNACIFVEWGLGEYRDMLWLDMSCHTVQLPTCAWVAVYGYAGNLEAPAVGQPVADVRAAVILGHAVTPDARWTHRHMDDNNGAGTVSGLVPPFARRLTLTGISDQAAAEVLFTQRNVYSPTIALLTYRASIGTGAAPSDPKPDFAPHALPVAAATAYDLAFSGAPAAAQSAVAAFEVAV